MRSLLVLIILLTQSQFALSQETDANQLKIDSLKEIISTTKVDSTRIKAYNDWSQLLYRSDPEEALKIAIIQDSLCSIYLKQDKSLAELDFFLDHKIKAMHKKGEIYRKKGSLDTAANIFNDQVQLAQLYGKYEGAAGGKTGIALIYWSKGNLDTAIVLINDALKIREKSKDSVGIASSINNIGVLHYQLADYPQAIKHWLRCLDIYQKLGTYHKAGNVLNNIGLVYSEMGKDDSAMYYQKWALSIRQSNNDIWGMGASYANLAIIHDHKGKNDSVLYYLIKAVELGEQINDYDGISNAYNFMGEVYIKQGQYRKAVDVAEKALKIAQQIERNDNVKKSSEVLWKSYKKLGQYDKALKMHELWVTMRDSIESESNQKALMEQEIQYEYEKQQLADSLSFVQQKELDDLAHEAELHKEAKQRYLLYGGLGFLLILGAMAFRGYQRKKKDNVLITKQKEQVEQQKGVIEEAHQEIRDSITYAQRIQSAILPPQSLIEKHLPENFVLYKPKDIVAGDFYWLEHQNNLTLFAAADCTGHGVPGAMVSVVCHNALNRAVREFKLTKPGEILNKAREIVIEEFSKSTDDVKDGMDICLCGLNDLDLTYSGAHNPLWIIRNGEILEYKGDKQPVGKFERSAPFTTHTIQLEKGDTFYIFSDGFVDQFGGEKGKKFKAKNLKELLLSIQDKPVQEHKTILNEAFEKWKGNLEQVDDVCVIGVRV